MQIFWDVRPPDSHPTHSVPTGILLSWIRKKFSFELQRWNLTCVAGYSFNNRHPTITIKNISYHRTNIVGWGMAVGVGRRKKGWLFSPSNAVTLKVLTEELHDWFSPDKNRFYIVFWERGDNPALYAVWRKLSMQTKAGRGTKLHVMIFWAYITFIVSSNERNLKCIWSPMEHKEEQWVSEPCYSYCLKINFSDNSIDVIKSERSHICAGRFIFFVWKFAEYLLLPWVELGIEEP